MTRRSEHERALAELDRARAEHALRIAVIAEGFCEELGLSAEELVAAYRAAMEE